MIEQRLRIVRQLEEPAFLGRPFDRGALGGELVAPCPVSQLLFLVERLVADRIPALVAIEIEIAIGLHRLPDCNTGFVVRGLCSANEAIIGYVKFVAHVFKEARHFVAQCLHLDVLLACGLDHLEAVLVGPGGEAHIAALHPLEPCNRIRSDRFVCVADVRAPVRVSDGGGDVIGFGHGRRSAFCLGQAVSLGMASVASKAPSSIATSPGSKL